MLILYGALKFPLTSLVTEADYHWEQYRNTKQLAHLELALQADAKCLRTDEERGTRGIPDAMGESAQPWGTS